MADEPDNPYEPPSDYDAVEDANSQELDSRNNRRRGVLLLVALHLLNLFYPWAFLVIGGSQLVYVIPGLIYFIWKKQTRVAQGLLIGAGVTLLINGVCWLGGMALFSLTYNG